MQIKDRLGHTDDQIMKNVYLLVTEDIKKEASQTNEATENLPIF